LITYEVGKMVARKRTTTKTGKYTKSTRTLSSTGKVTHSSSSKPPGSTIRRTVSHSNGKMRTTHSTKLGGGLVRVTTKTQTLVSKPKVTKSKGLGWISGRRSRTRETTSNESDKSGEFSWFWAIIGIIALPITIPYMLFGPWITAIILCFAWFYFFG